MLENNPIPLFNEYFINDPTSRRGFQPKPSPTLWPAPEGLREEVRARLADDKELQPMLEAFDVRDNPGGRNFARGMINMGRLNLYILEISGFLKRNPRYLEEWILEDESDRHPTYADLMEGKFEVSMPSK